MKLTFTASDANAAGLDLKAETALILPKGSGYAGLHAAGGLLAGGVKVGVLGLDGALAGDGAAGQRQNILRGAHAVGDGGGRGRGGRGGEAIGVAVCVVYRVRVLGVRRLQHGRGLLVVVSHGARGDGLGRVRLAGREMLRIVHVGGGVIHGVVADNGRGRASDGVEGERGGGRLGAVGGDGRGEGGLRSVVRGNGAQARRGGAGGMGLAGRRQSK